MMTPTPASVNPNDLWKNMQGLLNNNLVQMGPAGLATCIQTINNQAKDIETHFNRLNSVPILAIFGSPLRTMVAAIQIVAAGIFLLIANSNLNPAQTLDPVAHKNWTLIKLAAQDHLTQGFLNVGRAQVEGLLAGTLVGTLVLASHYFYQASSDNSFEPLIGYGRFQDIRDCTDRSENEQLATYCYSSSFGNLHYRLHRLNDSIEDKIKKILDRVGFNVNPPAYF